MDTDEALKLLRTDQSGIFELAQVTTFIGYRRGQDDVEREITVEILDAGSAAGDERFVVEITEDRAEDEDEADFGDDAEATIHASGRSLAAAVAALPWGELD